MWTYLGLGVSMGLSAGTSPGPLLALVITASLRSGLAGGLAVALAPLVTDLPIIGLSVLLVGTLPPEALSWVGTVGGLVVLWIGVETIRAAQKAVAPGNPGAQTAPRQELWRGVLVNALNPHPYIFWATIGGPALVSGWRISPWHAFAFLVSFYTLLVGSKIVIAWLVSGKAGGLSHTWYRRVLAASGGLTLLVGGWLIYRAWAA